MQRITIEKKMKVPILIYHDVKPKESMDIMSGNQRYYCLEENKFRNHINYISENEFNTMKIGELPCKNSKLKLLIITFDDGLESHYSCYRILKSRNLTATFFIVTHFIGKKGYLTWDQVKEMHADGMDIQSHTCTHPFLNEITTDRLINEFKDSKRQIEKKLNVPVDSVSIPQGFVNEKVVRMAVDCGYKYIFTSHPGLYKIGEESSINRLSIYNRTSLRQFERLVNKNYFELLKQQLYKAVLCLPKKILGTNNYHLLRKGILNLKKK